MRLFKKDSLLLHECGSSNKISLRLNHQNAHPCVDVFLYGWKFNYCLRARILVGKEQNPSDLQLRTFYLEVCISWNACSCK